MDSKIEERLDVGKAALLVVDVQNDFCHSQGVLGKMGIDISMAQGMAANLQKFIEEARAVSLPVIFIMNEHTRWSDSTTWVTRHSPGAQEICRPGSFGADFYLVQPRPEESIIIKHRYSAFVGTDLDLILRSRSIKNLFVTGVATNVCVESTARHAFMLDYQLVYVEDCLAAASKAEHDASLENMKRYFAALVLNSKDVVEAWKDMKVGG